MTFIVKIDTPKFYVGLDRLKELFEFLYDVDCFVAGGFARFCVLNDKLDRDRDLDIDVFFPNIEEYNKALLNFSQADSRLKHHGPFGVLFGLQKIGAVNFVRPIKFRDIVTGGTIEDVLMHFDFTVCAVAINKQFQVFRHFRFYSDIQHACLRFICLPEDPSRAFRRILKYVKIGYHCPASTMRELFLACPQFIAECCLENINTETRISDWLSTRYKSIDLDKYLIHADETQAVNR